MKKLTVLLALLLGHVASSQTDIDRILEIGIPNALQFSGDYFVPVGESIVNNASNGWYNTAKTKKLWHFEVGFVGNLSFVREEKQSFILNTAEYTDVTFRDGSTSQQVTNAFGSNQQNISVVINQGEISELEVILPNGLGGAETNLLPAGFLQASLGLIKSTEIKARFLPRIKAVEETEIRLYGVAFQHEFTDWVYRLKRWPVRLAALLGYTNVKGFYNINESLGQEVQLTSNSWVFTSIISTKLPVLNFYGGLGWYFGSSNAAVLGGYQIQNGPSATDLIIDPLKVKNKARGVKATLGARVKFGAFNANLDYSLQNYNSLSLALRFGL